MIPVATTPLAAAVPPPSAPAEEGDDAFREVLATLGARRRDDPPGDPVAVAALCAHLPSPAPPLKLEEVRLAPAAAPQQALTVTEVPVPEAEEPLHIRRLEVSESADDPPAPADPPASDAAGVPDAPAVVAGPDLPPLPEPTPDAEPRIPDSGPLLLHLRRALEVPPPDQGPVELSFSEPELGQVRLLMRGKGRMVSVAIEAERAETLALLQAHVETLLRDLDDLGYPAATVTFAVTEGGGVETAVAVVPAPETGPPAATAETAAQPDRLPPPRDGLDLRL